MRINAKEQPELAAKISAVFLNGKLIKQCHAFDTEEGWVESYVPDIPPGHDLKKGKDNLVRLDNVSNVIVKRHGTVRVAIHNEST